MVGERKDRDDENEYKALYVVPVEGAECVHGGTHLKWKVKICGDLDCEMTLIYRPDPNDPRFALKSTTRFVTRTQPAGEIFTLEDWKQPNTPQGLYNTV